MSWLAKINLNIIVKQLGAFKSALLLLILIAICLYSGYRIGNFHHGFQKQTITQQKTRLNKLYEQQVQQVKRIHTLEVELEIERMANQESQKMLTEIEKQHFQVKKDLAFYEKVMAPEKQADGVVIEELSISPTGSFNHFRFQVVLVQQQVKKRYAKGFIEMSFDGSLANKPSKFTLQNVSKLTKKELAFSFKYFQIIEGEFTFPENFVPEKIQLAAILEKTKWQEYNRIDERYAWQDVIENLEQTMTLILD